MTADDPIDEALTELAKRRGTRAADIMNAVFDDFGLTWRNPAYGAEIAAQCRTVTKMTKTNDFGANLASIITRVFAHFGYDHDPAAVLAAVRQHLVGGRPATSGPARPPRPPQTEPTSPVWIGPPGSPTSLWTTEDAEQARRRFREQDGT